jgi:hypothetical protein
VVGTKPKKIPRWLSQLYLLLSGTASITSEFVLGSQGATSHDPKEFFRVEAQSSNLNWELRLKRTQLSNFEL